jgi:hypothetical protein
MLPPEYTNNLEFFCTGDLSFHFHLLVYYLMELLNDGLVLLPPLLLEKKESLPSSPLGLPQSHFLKTTPTSLEKKSGLL